MDIKEECELCRVLECTIRASYLNGLALSCVTIVYDDNSSLTEE